MNGIRTIFLGKKRFFALIILGLFVINAIWLIPTLQRARASASVFALTVAERMRSEINGSLGNALNQTVGIAGGVADEPERTVITFSDLLRYHSIFTSIALVDRSGKELVRIDSSGRVSPEKFFDQSRNTSFYLALQGRTVFTQPSISSDGEPHITLIVPVPKKGEFVGSVIIAELDIQNLLSIIRSPKIGEGHVYVLDRDGIEILNPDVAKILQHRNFSTRAIVKKVLVEGATADGLASDDGYVNNVGEDTFTVGMPVPVVRWGVFVEQPRAAALAGVRQTIVLAVVTSMLAIIIFLVVAFSVTKLRKLTIQLEEANVRLEEFDKLKSEFVSMAGHQLRAPMTVIKGYLSLIMEGTIKPATPEEKNALEKAMFSTNQLIKLVSNLLDLARIESGKIKYEFVRGDFTKMIHEVIEKFRENAEKKKIKIAFRDGEGEPMIFAYDADKMREAVVNLIDNAIKYSSENSEVRVREELAMGEGGQRMRLTVQDGGMGIKPEDISMLFEKFSRTEEAKEKDPSGMGIGLYFLKRIVQDHGGAVGVQSAGIGKGSTFWIEIPMSRD